MIAEPCQPRSASAETRSLRLQSFVVDRFGSVAGIRGKKLAALLIAGWALVGVAVGLRLNQGWVPHDDGSFAQSAHRVLQGELPHRDFAELYTGGLTFLNAAVFWSFGENLIWLRFPLFIAFLASVPCIYYIARRFTPPLGAGLVTVAASAWGLPAYPAAVPSWYVLFLAIGGCAALFRYLEVSRARWLFIAGLLGGMSISIKIVGVYYVLAVLCFLTFVDQRRHWGPRRRLRLPDLLACGVVPFAFVVICAVIRKRFGAPELVNFVVPVLAVTLFAIAAEANTTAGDVRRRLRRRAGLMLPFVLGVLVPTAVLATPFIATGSIGDAVRGVLITPQSRIDFSYVASLPPIHLVWTVPLIAALFAPVFVSRRWAAPIALSGLCVLISLVILSTTQVTAFDVVLGSAREWATVVAVFGVVALLVGSRRDGGRGLEAPLLLLLSMVAFLAFVQYPFGTAVYYCYVAPLVVLASVGLVAYLEVESLLVPTLLLCVYAAFAILMVDRGYLVSQQRDAHTVILDSHRASIRVTPAERSEYRRAAGLLAEHGSGRYIYAGPDAPELYFLADRENPTRALFDFLDDTRSARGNNLLHALEAHGVTAIAINYDPKFSPRLQPSTIRALRAIYPWRTDVGRFEVRWKTS